MFLRNAKKSAQKITTLEQNIVDAENRLRAMKEERDTIESDGRKMLQCIEEIAEQLENGEEEYAGEESGVGFGGDLILKELA